MQNNCKRIVFAGSDNYDLVYYLGIFLNTLGKKVLLMDNSDDKALSLCMPEWNTLKMEGEFLHCEEWDFIDDTDQEPEGYDYVLVDCGRNYGHPSIAVSDHIFLVADTKLHNLEPLQSQLHLLKKAGVLIRDIPQGMNTRYLSRLFDHMGLKGVTNHYFYWYETDKVAGLRLQYNHGCSYKRLSSEIQLFIKEVLMDLCGFERKEVVEAENRIRKGRVRCM